MSRCPFSSARFSLARLRIERWQRLDLKTRPNGRSPFLHKFFHGEIHTFVKPAFPFDCQSPQPKLPAMQLTVSSKGQIVLPAPVRRRLRLKARSKLELEEREDGLFLRPAKTRQAAFAPIEYAPPGTLKFGARDRELDRFADAAGEDDAP